jgi:hypothetical protein
MSGANCPIKWVPRMISLSGELGSVLVYFLMATVVISWSRYINRGDWS